MSSKRKEVDQVNGEGNKDKKTLKTEQGKIDDDADVSVDEKLGSENHVNGTGAMSTPVKEDELSSCTKVETKADVQDNGAHNDSLSLPTIPQACEEENMAGTQYALHIASKKGLVDIVDDLLKHDADVNQQNAFRQTPMHCAIIGGHVSVVKVLLNCRPSPDLGIRDKNGRSPLLCAVDEDRVDIVRELLCHQSYVNMRDADGYAGLHLAVKKGSLKMVRLLLRSKANPNNRDDKDLTALHWAISEKQIEVVRLLLEGRADENAEDEIGQSPLHWAVKCDFFDAVRELLRWNSDPDAKDDCDRSPLHLAAKAGDVKILRELLEYRADIETCDKWGLTPLFYAISGDRVEMVKELLRLNADSDTPSCLQVNVAVTACSDCPFAEPDDDGSDGHDIIENNHVDSVALEDIYDTCSSVNDISCTTASANVRNLHSYPLQLASFLGNIKIVQALLEHGVDVTVRDHNDFNAWHWAFIGGRVNVVKEFIRRKVDINSKTTDNITPLHLAMMGGHRGTVLELLKNKADIEARDVHGHSPFLYAASTGKEEAIRAFLEMNPDYDVNDMNNLKQSNSGQTALHEASEKGHVGVVKVLLGKKAKTDLMNSDGNTALYLASREGHLETVETLLGACDSNLMNGYPPSTALQIAVEKEHIPIVQKLLEHGADPNPNPNRAEQTPLFTALRANHFEMVIVLLKYHADPFSAEEGLPFCCWALKDLQGDHNIENLLKYLDEVRNDTGFSLLHLAVKAENVVVLQHVIRRDHSLVNSRDWLGSTPLHEAVLGNNLYVVKELVLAGADLNLKDRDGLTPLYVAAWKSKSDNAKELCSYPRIDPNIVEKNGLSPLHWAARNGSADLVEALLKCGADMNSKSSDGLTPLYWAARNGHTRCVKALLSDELDLKDENGLTPLFWAAAGGHSEVVEVLTTAEHSVDVGLQYEVFSLLHMTMMRHSYYIIRKSSDDPERNYSDTVALLIKCGADVNFQDPAGDTPLDYAVRIEDYPILKAVVAGSEVEKVQSKTINDMSALHFLSLENDMDVSQLASLKALTNWASFHQHTLLQLGATLGNQQNVNRLLKLEGVDLDHCNIIDQTSLHSAAHIGNDEIVDNLLFAGADPTLVDKFHMTALHVASMHGHCSLVERFIKAGVDPNLTDNLGRNCLHLAVLYRREDVVKLLLKEGIKTYLKDNSEKTPQDYLLPCEETSLTFKQLVGESVALAEICLNEDASGHIVIQNTPNLNTLWQNSPNLRTLWKTPGIGSVYCIKNCVEDYVNRIKMAVTKVVIEAIKLFTGSRVDVEVIGVGSSFEGTKVGLPNELDFLIKIDTIHYSAKFEGYLQMDQVTQVTEQLQIKSSHGVWLWEVLMNYWCRSYTKPIDSDGSSLSMPLPPQRHPDHKTCTTWVWSYSDHNFKDFPVSVDFVPAIEVPRDCYMPSEMEWEGLTDKEKCSYIVPKIPYKKENSKFLTEGKFKKEDINKLGRQSFPTIEMNYLQSLDKEHNRVKEVLITAKCLRKPEVCGFKVKTTIGKLVPVNEFVTSYHLKTVFLHLIKAFQESHMSLGRMVLLIYEKLERCLQKENLPMFFKSRNSGDGAAVNVLAGSRLNAQECAAVTSQMVTFVRALYERDYNKSEQESDAVEIGNACPWMPECFLPQDIFRKRFDLRESKDLQWKEWEAPMRDGFKGGNRYFVDKGSTGRGYLTLENFSESARMLRSQAKHT